MDRRLSRTAYCNKECQKVDWGTHKTACKDARTRKQLYRAGELVQTLFYDLREVAFDNVINGVEHKGDRLIVSAGYWDLPPSKIFTRFPTHLFPDAGDKQAMLVWNACGDSVCCMHELVETCLTGKFALVKSTARRLILRNRYQQRCPRSRYPNACEREPH